MKKLYSIVLMATMLLVGTNMWAATHQVSTIGELETAWANAKSGDVIQLTASMQTTKIFWLGTSTKDATSRSLTLDLNGNILSDNVIGGSDGLHSMFVISKGELNVITSVPGGQIVGDSWQACGSSDKIQDLFFLGGTDQENIDPKQTPDSANFNGYFTHLTIGEGVTINASSPYGNGIVVDYLDNYWPVTSSNAVAAAGTTNYGTSTNQNFRGDNNWNNAAPYQYLISGQSAKGTAGHYKRAWGVRVDVYGNIRANKYGMKVNGFVQKPSNINASPFIHIHNSGDVYVPGTSGSAAVYSSGYGRWLIEGKCEGASGVYVKSGILDIDDATIASNQTTPYVAPTNNTGVSGGGSAILVQSTTNNDYAGSIEVTISGDTKVTATNGYAIEEVITKYPSQPTAGTKVSTIDIEGGTFEGGNVGTIENPQEGTIIITATTVNNQTTTVTIAGGQVTTGGNMIGEDGLADYLSNSGGTHVTYVENEDGKTVMVISEGQGPDTANPDATISGVASGDDVYVLWGTKPASDAAMADALTADKEFAELIINDTTTAGAPKEQVLTINSGVTLKVGRVILGKGAQIIVNPGAKFIVTGAQGIVAPVVSNILLKAEEGNPAIFVFNPAVTSNRHPNATVEFVSRSFTVSSSNYAFQRFGIPTTGKLADITTKYNNADVATAFMAHDYAINDWVNIGYINAAGKTQLDTAKLSNPFEYYQMQHNTPNMGTVVTFKGELVGNEIPAIGARSGFYNGYANSTTGNMSITEVIDEIPGSVQMAVYLNNVQAHQKVWESYTKMNGAGKFIQPMQPFLIRNNNEAVDISLKYGDAVYYPTTGEAKPNAAPARRSNINNITMANIFVKGENTYDHVIVGQDEMFSAEFDNGYDAAKLMNDGINMYVSADEKMAIFATDNLENTYVGFQAVNGGTYTIEFADVQGDELALIDHETGAEVLIVEGNTYEFAAAANSANDYRFEIVSPRKVTTAIENAEAVKSAKGIYTITGQYMGEMSVWNSLPAGVYVVNGEKRVK